MTIRRWTTNEIEHLTTLIQDPGLTLLQVAEILGRTETSVGKMSHKLGIQRRPAKARTVNDSVFSEDTPSVAYWAGFLMSDGNVNRRKVNTLRVQLHVSRQDRSHLQSFADFIGYNGAISETKTGGVMMAVNSLQMSTDLQRWGVIPNKTKDGTFPDDLLSSLIPHYIRGLIDGDGGIYVFESNGRTHWDVSLTNNEAIITKVAEILRGTLGIRVNTRSRHNKKTGHTTWCLNIGAKEYVTRTLLWLGYDGDGPWLPRKREAALRIIKDSA